MVLAVYDGGEDSNAKYNHGTLHGRLTAAWLSIQLSIWTRLTKYHNMFIQQALRAYGFRLREGAAEI